MIILLQCADRVGLVADIAKVMADARLNILAMKEYVNVAENRFFIRLHVDKTPDVENLKEQLLRMLPDDTQIQIAPTEKKKIAVMVTKEYHCLGDILLRNYFDNLNASVQCVIGNYDNLRALTEKFNIPFHYISHEEISKEDFEKSVAHVLSQYECDYIVLAKFMRILSPDFIARYPNQIINIHHSFLPAFIGANPYKQAHERGVKIIGATAHYVTNTLDEGPIISQEIIPVNHGHTVSDMRTLGKEIEKAVLAKALGLVFQDRVLVHANKTIVFEN
ncbi:MAG: formyltetrahydrofolate deformylase [Niabella sp.]